MSEDLTAAEIGDRLRVARESAKVTQAAAAEALQVARTTVVAIEQCQRRPRLDELHKFAALYAVSVNSLLRREAVQIDLKPRFRRAGEADADVEAAVALRFKAKRCIVAPSDGRRRSMDSVCPQIPGAGSS